VARQAFAEANAMQVRGSGEGLGPRAEGVRFEYSTATAAATHLVPIFVLAHVCAFWKQLDTDDDAT